MYHPLLCLAEASRLGHPSGNSDLDDDLTSLLVEQEVVRVKSEGVTPLPITHIPYFTDIANEYRAARHRL